MTSPTHTYLYNIILAIGIGILIIYFLPSFFSKYQVNLVEQDKFESDTRLIWFADLNNDGYSDKILRWINGGSQTPYLKIEDKGELFYEQWNISGEWLTICPLMIGDYDNNGFSELFALSFKNDSIFINGFEPYKLNGYEIKSRFIFQANKYNMKQDWYVKSNKFIDLNNDGYKDIVFTFIAGFTRQPRKIVAYDIKNDKIITSGSAGIALVDFSYCDIDSDGKTEILGKTFASDNYNEEFINLTDTNSYLLIYDNKLDLKYPPDTNLGVSTNIIAIPFKNNLVSIWIGRTAYNHARTLKIHQDKYGSLYSIEKDLSGLFTGNPQMLVAKDKHNDKLYLIENDNVIEFDDNLKQISGFTSEYKIGGMVEILDFEEDGSDEFLFVTKMKNRIIICRNEFDHPVSIDNIGVPTSNPNVSIRKVKRGNILRFPYNMDSIGIYMNTIGIQTICTVGCITL